MLWLNGDNLARPSLGTAPVPLGTCVAGPCVLLSLFLVQAAGARGRVKGSVRSAGLECQLNEEHIPNLSEILDSILDIHGSFPN